MSVPSSSNTSQKSKSGGQTILWWIVWITLTIVSFFVASAFWTPLIARHFGSIHESKNAVIWVAAVFGTWIIFLVPLIVFMYQKVDKAYDDARIRREKSANQFRSISVEKSKRMLSSELSNKLAQYPNTIEGGQLVTVVLKNGDKISNVFVANRDEILGIYNAREFSFEGKEVADVEINDMSRPPFFVTANWLRLDGVKSE